MKSWNDLEADLTRFDEAQDAHDPRVTAAFCESDPATCDCVVHRSLRERARHMAASAAKSSELDSYRPETRKKLTLVSFWCPTRGGESCRAAVVYRLENNQMLLESFTRHRRHSQLLQWAYPDDFFDNRMQTPATCTHGGADLSLPWIWACIESREAHLEGKELAESPFMTGSLRRGAKTGRFAIDV